GISDPIVRRPYSFDVVHFGAGPAFSSPVSSKLRLSGALQGMALVPSWGSARRSASVASPGWRRTSARSRRAVRFGCPAASSWAAMCSRSTAAARRPTPPTHARPAVARARAHPGGHDLRRLAGQAAQLARGPQVVRLGEAGLVAQPDEGLALGRETGGRGDGEEDPPREG